MKDKDFHRMLPWRGCVLILFAFLALIDVALPLDAIAQKSLLQGAHANKSLVAKSCRACHRGMTMALSGEEDSCLTCHGDAGTRDRMVQGGYLKSQGASLLRDIANELRKPYNHPVLTIQGVHRQLEALPEEVVNAARHSECVDCHNPHVVEKGKPFRGLQGRRVGNLIAEIEKEYELCYRCHSESANLPGNFSDKHAEFKTTNPSFHPVEGEGKNTVVISLKEPYVAQKKRPNEISQISCGDCHGSDDPAGPRGPHGSENQGLLVLNYQTDDERPESEQAYALCYKCHDRVSILSNESFPYHSLHIQGRLAGQDGTSCFTCHDSHGSTQYTNLIKFNQNVVFENAAGKLKFDAQGYSARHGSCSLSCHGVEHDAKDY
jgi:hypothetical protein